jgi:transposase
MNKDSTAGNGVTIGLDLGDKFSQAYVIGSDGDGIEDFRVRSSMKGIQRAFARYDGGRVVLEVGSHSPWVSRQLSEMGLEVIVANPRRVRLISQSDSKNDKLDAEQLARLGRVDPALLSPVLHRGEATQRDLALLRARDGLVRARTQLINQVRGLAKPLGTRLPSCSAERFAGRMTEELPADFFPGLATMLKMIQELTDEIRRMDRQIAALCADGYPETQLLRQVKGVGPITALAFLLTLEDPTRFRRSRAVGAYLGLRPRQRDSGDRRPQLRITKAGDEFVRRLLVSAAHYILGPFGPDTDLRRFGLRLAERGGRSGKKRAIVAVARKLAVLLHRLWITGEHYEPLGYSRAVSRAA